MGEKFNSGIGGYTCDTCSILLWAGRDGDEKPENRRYIYTAEPGTVLEDGQGHWFCSNRCRSNYKGRNN